MLDHLVLPIACRDFLLVVSCFSFFIIISVNIILYSCFVARATPIYLFIFLQLLCEENAVFHCINLLFFMQSSHIFCFTAWGEEAIWVYRSLQLGHLVMIWLRIERVDNSWPFQPRPYAFYKMADLIFSASTSLCDCLKKVIYSREPGWCSSDMGQRRDGKHFLSNSLSLSVGEVMDSRLSLLCFKVSHRHL